MQSMLKAIKGNKRFTSGSITALLIYGSGAGLTLVTQLVIARLAGAEAFGEYAYVAAWIVLLASVTTLGFQTALLRLLPSYINNEQWSEARGARGFALGATTLASATVALAGVAIVTAFVSPTDPSLGSAFIIGFLAVPFIALQFTGAATSRAFGGVFLAMAPDRIVRDLIILATVTAVAISDVVPMTSSLVVGALLLSALTTSTLSHAAAWRLTPPELNAHAPKYCKSEWSRLAAPLILLTLADNLMHRSGVLVLGLSGRHVEAGVFAVAVSFAQLAAMPRMAAAIMFAPSASALYARRDMEALQLLLHRAAWLSLIGTLCVALPLLLVLPFLLPRFGGAFSEGILISLILVVAQVFSASRGPQQHLLTMTGHERDGARLLTTASASCVAASFVVLQFVGIIGVALVMAASLVGWNLAMARFLKKRLKISAGLQWW